MPVDCSADNHNTQGNGKFHSGDCLSDYLTKNNLLSVTEISEAEYRVVVLGSEATGKTCLISQLLYDIFPRDLVSTVEEMYRDVSPRAELNAFCSSRVHQQIPVGPTLLKLIHIKSPVWGRLPRAEFDVDGGKITLNIQVLSPSCPEIFFYFFSSGYRGKLCGWFPCDGGVVFKISRCRPPW